jgi:hypothetical protein
MRATVIAALAALVAAPALAAPAAAASDESQKQAQKCVFIANIQQTRVVDDRTIDFVMNDGRMLRNNLPNACPGLKINRSFAYRTSQSQLCNVDIITVVVQGAGPVRGASCGLGSFTPIEVPAKK